MKRELDHLVIAARTLEEGGAWVESRLGVAPQPGGKHSSMGTHNLLLSLGPSHYLEVIAIDPDAPPPQRPRWFELDTPAMHERLAKSPAFIHWADRTDDLQAAIVDYPAPVDILSFMRGDFRWRMALTRDGSLPARGTIPTMIQWDGAHPCSVLPDRGIRLARFTHENGELAASFSITSGIRTIP